MQILDSIVDGVLDMAEYDEESAGALILTIIRYMRTGEEPEDLAGHVRSAWIMLLPVIRKSRSKSQAGRSKRESNANQTQIKTESKRSKCLGFDSQFDSLSSSSSYSLSKEGVQGEEANGFDPPTLGEVRAYFDANCLRGDPEAFFDFYESQGWRKSNGLPISSWTSQAKQWHRRQAQMDAERASRGEPIPEDSKWRPAASADPVGDAERAQEEYERAAAMLTPEERRRLNLG